MLFVPPEVTGSGSAAHAKFPDAQVKNVDVNSEFAKVAGIPLELYVIIEFEDGVNIDIRLVPLPYNNAFDVIVVRPVPPYVTLNGAATHDGTPDPLVKNIAVFALEIGLNTPVDDP